MEIDIPKIPEGCFGSMLYPNVQYCNIKYCIVLALNACQLLIHNSYRDVANMKSG